MLFLQKQLATAGNMLFLQKLYLNWGRSGGRKIPTMVWPCKVVRAGSHLMCWEPRSWLAARLHALQAHLISLQAWLASQLWLCLHLSSQLTLCDDGEPPETCYCYFIAQAKAPKTKSVGETVVCAKGRERRIPVTSSRHH